MEQRMEEDERKTALSHRRGLIMHEGLGLDLDNSSETVKEKEERKG